MPETAETLILAALCQYTLRTGPQLSDMTGLTVSELYPALVRLEREGKIIGEWDDMPRPRRRRYRVVESFSLSGTTVSDRGSGSL